MLVYNSIDYRERLIKKLNEINLILTEYSPNVTDVGILTGDSGISLFKFHYAKHFQDESSYNEGVKFLEKCFDKINDGYFDPTFCTGIAGLGWSIDYLTQKDFIDIDADKVLFGLDSYIENTLNSSIKNNHYDFLHGCIGYGMFFLNRYKNTKSEILKRKYQDILINIVSYLYQSSEEVDISRAKWLSKVYHPEQNVYNNGLAHGMSSILGFLTYLLSQEEFDMPVAKRMLQKTSAYICGTAMRDEISVFPDYILQNNSSSGVSRLGWCYGDLTISLRLWYASKILKDDKLQSFAYNVMLKSAARRDDGETFVVDATICHGAYGIAKVFDRLYVETNDPVFLDAHIYWIVRGLDMAIPHSGLAGYQHYKGDHWADETGIIEGIAGIGLVVMDHLFGSTSAWEECLMIS